MKRFDFYFALGSSAVIASEAKQSRPSLRLLDCVVATLLAMTWLDSGGREFGLGGCEGPVEPFRQNGDIVCLHCRAAPDAQAGRRVAIGADVVSGLFLLDQRGQLLGEGRLRIRGEG